MRPLATFFVLSALGLSGAAVASSPDELIKPCIGCHGTDGTGTTPKTPHINWQSPAYLHDTMVALQNETRPTAVPKHIPKSLSGDNLSAISDHYGKNRTPRVPQTTDPEKAKRGQQVFLDRCLDCHNDNGRESNDSNSPILANQQVEYLIAQEHHYASGKRKYSFKADVAHKGITPADMEAVSHFFASQDVQPPTKGKKKR